MITRNQVTEGMVKPGTGLYCYLDHKLVAFVRLEPDGMVVVSDWLTGKELPDYRHPSQVTITSGDWVMDRIRDVMR